MKTRFYIRLEFERLCKPSNDDSNAFKVVIIEEISEFMFGNFKGLYPLKRKAASSSMEDAHQFTMETFVMEFGACGESTIEAVAHLLDILKFIDNESEMSDFEMTVLDLEPADPLKLNVYEEKYLRQVLATAVNGYNYNHIGVAYKEDDDDESRD